MPQYLNLNQNWRFSLSDHPETMKQDFDDCAFEMVHIPHDWSVTGHYDAQSAMGQQGGFFQCGTVGWYRKRICISKEQKQKRLWLHFEGILETGTVYLNGEEIGCRPYGYFPAVYEITNRVREGLNLLAVRADCSRQPFSRWFNGAGIFRNVWLVSSGANRILPDGVFVRTGKMTEHMAEVCVSTELELKQSVTAEISLSFGDRQVIRVCRNLTADDKNADFLLRVENPRLWSADTPNLYRLTLRLLSEKEILDQWQTECGIRQPEWIPGQGLKINGNPVKLKGVCLHHDVGITGAAAAEETLRYRLGLLKKMGCNALRTTHNPFSESFYRLCDEMGFYVIDEAFDGWETPKAKYDYGTVFAQYHRQDLESFVRRDRNHPCVLLWSIGNEVLGATPKTTRELMGIVKALDHTRPVTCGVQGTGKESEECRALLDVAGYNDGGGACFIYDRDHKNRPDQLFVATESPHTLQTRGFYRTRTWWRDKNQPRKEIPNLTQEELFHDGCDIYTSSYDNAGVRLNIRDCWENTKNTPYLTGEFRWTGPDYYGESICWPARARGYGVIDLADIPKDSYYLYQALWTEPEQEAVLHILPHWTHTFPEGTPVPVFVYTNCQRTELFLNGQSLGSRTTGDIGYAYYQVPYHKGCLTAKGYIGDVCVRTAAVQTAGEAEKISLRRTYGNPEAEELCEIQAVILDRQGTEVPSAQNPVLFFGEGVQITGTENGDPADLTPLTSHTRKAFYGKCMTLVRGIANQPYRRVTAFGLLGPRYFENQAEVHIAHASLPLSGNCPAGRFSFQYSINDGPWLLYENEIFLTDSAEIRVRVLQDGRQTGTFGAAFLRGNAPVFEDLTHGNETLMTEKPAGPFSDKIAGTWRLNPGDTLFRFEKNGEVNIDIGKEKPQRLGWWWYDFPTDYLEAQEYAGTGEIWFLSGEKEPIALEDQAASKMLLDNTLHGYGAFFENAAFLTLTKVPAEL